MKSWGKMEAIVASVVIGLVFLVVMVLTGAIPGIKTSEDRGGVTLTSWGFLTNKDLEKTFGKFNSENFGSMQWKYSGKNADTYEEDLLNALAGGTGPDIFMMSQDMVLKHSNKVYTIPTTAISQRVFLDTFVDSAEIFWTENGVMAVPFAVDPVVMYWNKDLFNGVGIATPPHYWDKFIEDVTALTNKDNFNNISQSGTALGEYMNVRNAKDILSMLVLQGGGKIIESTPRGVEWVASKPSGLGNNVVPFVSALTFYTNFSNPSKTSYSWNRALPNSRDMFLSGKLAMYFGFASEYNYIKNASPHLNFDVALVPQVDNSSVRATYGRVYAWAVAATSLHKVKAVEAIFSFTSPVVLATMANDTIPFPPSRRDLIGLGSSNSAYATFYAATLLTRSWPEPGTEITDKLFKDMIEAVVTGKKNVSEAVSTAEIFFKEELKKFNK